MTQVDFYILDSDSDDARLKLACKIVDKATQLDHHVYLHSTSDDEARKLAHGHRLDATGTGPDPVAAFAPDGHLVALVSDTGPTARPLVVLAPA